jgi:hypothetical protein
MPSRLWNFALVSFPEYFVRYAKPFRRFIFYFVASQVGGAGILGNNAPVSVRPTLEFGAFDRDLLHKLEQTVKSLAGCRHLIEYARIKLVLQARRFVT